MKVQLLRANISDAKELHAMQIGTAFPQYLYCRNFKVRESHRKQFGYVKKWMGTKIGNWTQFCRDPKIVICMRKWDIDRQAKRKLLTKNLH